MRKKKRIARLTMVVDDNFEVVRVIIKAGKKRAEFLRREYDTPKDMVTSITKWVSQHNVGSIAQDQRTWTAREKLEELLMAQYEFLDLIESVADELRDIMDWNEIDLQSRHAECVIDKLKNCFTPEDFLELVESGELEPIKYAVFGNTNEDRTVMIPLEQ